MYETQKGSLPSPPPDPLAAAMPLLSEPGVDPPLVPAGERDLRGLVFATDSAALGRGLGVAGMAGVVAILGALRAAGAGVVDLAGESPADAATAAQSVRGELSAPPDGIVLLGGYDVLPAQRLDCLEPALRHEIAAEVTEDPDDFCVWSDDIYGDLDGGGFPTVPVSRIPDGHSLALVRAALATGPPVAAPGRKSGLRNLRRPFAAEIFDLVPGDGGMATSAPVCWDEEPPDLAAEHLYLMLHGDHRDARSYWGEGSRAAAMSVRNVSRHPGAVVFTGCCWGALPVVEPARFALARPTPHSAESSIALSFLAGGARAFVGCTGAHYSPLRPPYTYFGAPLHEAFWRAVLAGAAPARALLEAKRAFLRDLPHGQTGRAAQAIERKILRQFTCLGLGW